MNESSEHGGSWEASFEHRFFTLLTRIYRLMHHHADHNMPAHALSPQQLWFLKRLHDAGSPQPISYFADGVISNRSNATQMIDRLQNEDLVSRVNNPTDRRSVLVELTESGSRRLHDGQKQLEDMAVELLKPLIPSERENIIAVFERVLSLLESRATLDDEKQK